MDTKTQRPTTYWLSYGGGVNSTALAVLLCEGKLPQYQPWRTVWADTQDEQDETYEYVFGVMTPYLRRHGVTLEVCRPDEGVIERWERLKVTGSRILRTCTKHGKIVPLLRHIDAHGRPEDEQIIGIDAGESHRAKQPDDDKERRKHYPLVDLDIDRGGVRMSSARRGFRSRRKAVAGTVPTSGWPTSSRSRRISPSGCGG